MLFSLTKFSTFLQKNFLVQHLLAFYKCTHPTSTPRYQKNLPIFIAALQTGGGGAFSAPKLKQLIPTSVASTRLRNQPSPHTPPPRRIMMQLLETRTSWLAAAAAAAPNTYPRV